MDSADRLKFFPEFIRKSIHLGCSVLPLLYYFYLSREQIIILSSIISIGFIISEYLRYRFKKARNIFDRIFGSLLRESEKNQTITGATFLFISATVTFVIFEKQFAVPAVLVLTISDSFAAIAGKSIISPGFFNKTMAGSFAFFVFTIVILQLFCEGKVIIKVAVAALLTVIEALPIKINDNILIPLATAGILYIVSQANMGIP